MVAIVFGLVLAGVAVLLVFLAKRAEKRVHYMKATDTTKVGAIVELANQVASEMPDGLALGFKDYVELKGKIVCDEPLQCEFSDARAAIVETQVVREYERREERRDPQGNLRTEWRRGSDTLSSNRREAIFYIDDGTGRLRVKPNKGVELVKIVERFEPASAMQSGFGGQVTLSLGRFQMSLGNGFDLSGSRTLGFRFIERILPIDKQAYALGEVAQTEDEGLVLRAPTDDDKKKTFIVSVRSEEDIVGSSQKSARILKIVAIVLAAGGAALLVLGLIQL